jgi:hypothetical protein
MIFIVAERRSQTQGLRQAQRPAVDAYLTISGTKLTTKASANANINTARFRLRQARARRRAGLCALLRKRGLRDLKSC